MYDKYMAQSRDEDDIAERAMDWLTKFETVYFVVGFTLLAVYVYYKLASRNSETKARIYRLEHATGL